MRKLIALVAVLLTSMAHAVEFNNGLCTDVTSDGKTVEWTCTDITPAPTPPPPPPDPTPLPSGLLTYNPEKLPDVVFNGSYLARVWDNTDNITLHYNNDQGRFDGYSVSFPFEAIAYNVGIADINDLSVPPVRNGTTYIFSGIQVHIPDYTSPNSAHYVVGHRSSDSNTLEVKSTVNGVSNQYDLGNNLAPSGRLDIRIVGVKGTPNRLDAYYRQPGATTWIPVQPEPIMVNWPNTVLIGLITYAYRNTAVPFAGIADGLTITQN